MKHFETINNYLSIYFFFIFCLFGIHIVFSHSAAAYEELSVPCRFSLEADREPIKDLFNEITEITSINIDIKGYLNNNTSVSVNLTDVSLIDGIRRILQNAHIKNYALFFDEENKLLRIHIYSENVLSKNNTESGEKTQYSTTSLHPREKRYNNNSITETKSSNNTYIKIDPDFDYDKIPPSPPNKNSETDSETKGDNSNSYVNDPGIIEKIDKDFNFDDIPPSPPSPRSNQ